MGLFDKKESKRKVGNGLDKDEIDKIFDALDKRDESKKVNKNLKKEMGHVREASNLLDDAQNQEMSGHFQQAVKLYEKILVLNPHDSEAYEGLVRIYQNQEDIDSEIKILKSAIQNVEGSVKNEFMKRLKEINK